MDVDGTLTDGKIYMSRDGEAFKAFDIKDGCGIKVILPQYNIIPVIITGRKSAILEQRCKELDIKEVHQDVHDKLKCLCEILNRYSTDAQTYSLADCAYIGDDLLDLPCIQAIKKAGGIAGCPRNAVNSIKQASNYVSPYNAGEGAVRDFIEYITKTDSASFIERIKLVMHHAKHLKG